MERPSCKGQTDKEMPETVRPDQLSSACDLFCETRTTNKQKGWAL